MSHEQALTQAGAALAEQLEIAKKALRFYQSLKITNDGEVAEKALQAIEDLTHDLYTEQCPTSNA